MAFSTNGTTGGNSLSSDINITPLIDVLLVLLIIFMVIVPMMPRGLNSKLPSDQPGQIVQEKANRPVLIEMQSMPAGVLYRVDGESLDAALLAPRLEELLARRSARDILLRADAELDYGIVAQVINTGQAAGAESVGLITPGLRRGE